MAQRTTTSCCYTIVVPHADQNDQMTRLTTIIIILLLSTWTFGQNNSSDKHPIDLKLEKCLSADSNFTTAGMISCEETARKEWDEELNKNYQLLMSILDSTAKGKLRTSQRQWIEFRDKELDFANQMFYEMEVTMWRVVAAGRRTEIIKQRALELRDYHKILTEKK